MTSMHSQEAPAPTIDQILLAVEGCEASRDELRNMIAAALADAKRKGAEERHQRLFPCCGGNDESPADHCMDCDLRQAVLLTDEQIDAERMRVGYAAGLERFCRIARAIETAVLAANGLEVRRG